MARKATNRPENALKTGADLLGLEAGSPELEETGKQLAQTAQTVTTLVNVVLLPIAAVNFGYKKAKEYFQSEFRDDFERITKRIPKGLIVEPTPSIAAPILQGLAFSHEEKDLKEMYLKLLATAMDEQRMSTAHPAYVEIIRQLTPLEAQALKDILPSNRGLPIVTIRTTTEKGYSDRYKNVVNFMKFDTETEINLISSMVDNWVRLGLISVEYDKKLTDDTSYAWVEGHMGYVLLEEKYKGKIDVVKGIMIPTNFGRLFAAAVITSNERYYEVGKGNQSCDSTSDASRPRS